MQPPAIVKSDESSLPSGPNRVTVATRKRPRDSADEPGQIAELPLFDAGSYRASAITIDLSRLVFLPRPAFEYLYRNQPDIARAVIRALGRHLRDLVHLTETLAFRDVAARLCSDSVHCSRERGVRVERCRGRTGKRGITVPWPPRSTFRFECAKLRPARGAERAASSRDRRIAFRQPGRRSDARCTTRMPNRPRRAGRSTRG